MLTSALVVNTPVRSRLGDHMTSDAQRPMVALVWCYVSMHLLSGRHLVKLFLISPCQSSRPQRSHEEWHRPALATWCTHQSLDKSRHGGPRSASHTDPATEQGTTGRRWVPEPWDAKYDGKYTAGEAGKSRCSGNLGTSPPPPAR